MRMDRSSAFPLMERGIFTLDLRSGTKGGFFRVFVSDTSSQGREVAFYLRIIGKAKRLAGSK